MIVLTSSMASAPAVSTPNVTSRVMTSISTQVYTRMTRVVSENPFIAAL